MVCKILIVGFFDTLLGANVLINRLKKEYNHIRFHSSLGYKSPAPEAP
tara:strand:+ start:95 stop:238 length:144 start_codon:yes stop_codon:yes gene_type:complete